MSFTKQSAIERAKQDLAERLDVDVEAVEELEVVDREFPDMSLGAPADGEMSAQMLSSGWEIRLGANDNSYEYRADKYHLRLVDFEGANYVVESD